jgi:hypothetical protein
LKENDEKLEGKTQGIFLLGKFSSNRLQGFGNEISRCPKLINNPIKIQDNELLRIRYFFEKTFKIHKFYLTFLQPK